MQLARATRRLLALALATGSAALAAPACDDFDIACNDDEQCPYEQICVARRCEPEPEGYVPPGEGGAGGAGGSEGSGVIVGPGSTSSGGPQLCFEDSNCPAGEYCDASTSTCRACDTAEHCGLTCATCSGLTPCCSAGVCSALGC